MKAPFCFLWSLRMRVRSESSVPAELLISTYLLSWAMTSPIIMDLSSSVCINLSPTRSESMTSLYCAYRSSRNSRSSMDIPFSLSLAFLTIWLLSLASLLWKAIPIGVSTFLALLLRPRGFFGFSRVSSSLAGPVKRARPKRLSALFSSVRNPCRL